MAVFILISILKKHLKSKIQKLRAKRAKHTNHKCGTNSPEGSNTQGLIMFVTLMLSVALKTEPALSFEVTSSTNQISIGSNFGGTNLEIVGTNLDKNAGVIITVKGEKEDYVVYQKHKKMKLWLNGKRRVFKDVYKFYAITSNINLDDSGISKDLLSKYELGVSNINLHQDTPLGASSLYSQAQANTSQVYTGIMKTTRDTLGQLIADQSRLQEFEFKYHFLRHKISNNLYSENYRSIKFSPNAEIFKASVEVPRNIPEGRYIVTTFLVAQGRIMKTIILPLKIKQKGLANLIRNMAHSNKITYTILAITTSISLALASQIISRRLRIRHLQRRLYRPD